MRYIAPITVFLTLCSGFVFADNQRDKIVAQELDCINDHLGQKDAIDWNDVCFLADNPLSTSQQKMQLVNQQMDSVQLAMSGQSPLSHPAPGTPALPNPTTFSLPAEDNQGNEWYDLEDNAPKSAASTVVVKKHEISFGPEFYAAKYEEPNLMHQEGSMMGYNLKYTYRPKENDIFHFNQLDMYRFQAQWASGKFDYSSNGTGTMSDKDNHTYDLRGVLGKDFFPNNSFRTTPYLGFGYRYLKDESQGRLTTTGHLGYDRESNYYYLPVGVDILYQIKPEYSMDSNIEFIYVARGKQVSKLGYIDGFSDGTNIQENGYGLRASLKLSRAFKGFSVFGEGFLRYWNMGQSNVTYVNETTGIIEPRNTTQEVGLRLGVDI